MQLSNKTPPPPHSIHWGEVLNTNLALDGNGTLAKWPAFAGQYEAKGWEIKLRLGLHDMSLLRHPPTNRDDECVCPVELGHSRMVITVRTTPRLTLTYTSLGRHAGKISASLASFNEMIVTINVFFFFMKISCRRLI